MNFFRVAEQGYLVGSVGLEPTTSISGIYSVVRAAEQPVDNPAKCADRMSG